jgi:hypothetical protein
MNTNSTSTEHNGRGRWIAAGVIALIILAIVLLGHFGGGSGGGAGGY